MILYAAVTCILILVTYGGIFSTFYQQDEWFSLGVVLARGIWAGMSDYSFVELLLGTQRVLGSLTGNIFHALFPLNIIPFAIFALVVHWANSMMLFRILLYATGNKTMAWLSGIFFSISYVHHQAVTWPAASVTTLGSAFFALFSLYMYIISVRTGRINLRLASFASLVVSMLFKDISVFFVAFLPIVGIVLMREKNTVGPVIKHHWPIFVYFTLTIGLRLLGFVSPDGQKGAFVTNNERPIERLAIHGFIYPVTSTGNMFIPPQMLWRMAQIIQTDQYPFLSGSPLSFAVLQNITGDLVSLILTIVVLFMASFIWLRRPDMRVVIVLSFLYILLSFFPYIPVEKASAYLDSRYYYLPMVGGAVLFGVYMDHIWRAFLVKRKKWYAFIFIGIVVLGGVYLYKNSISVKRTILALQRESRDRLAILDTVQSLYAKDAKRTVFFVTGNRTYLGTDGHHMPVQQNIGYTLLVLRATRGVIFEEALADISLFQIGRQWYRENREFSFGYFWDEEDLREVIIDKRLDPADIIGIYYDSEKGQVENISVSLRQRIFDGI